MGTVPMKVPWEFLRTRAPSTGWTCSRRNIPTTPSSQIVPWEVFYGFVGMGKLWLGLGNYLKKYRDMMRYGNIYIYNII